jgi:hypothetical protein
MINHIDQGFLADEEIYAHSEKFWHQLWVRVDASARDRFGWVQPWFQPLPRELAEGNPIFSAVSRQLRRGIRVIQHEPIKNEVEIQAWLDSFGGDHDSTRINELVISCALSDVSSEVALGLMVPWVQGDSPAFGQDESASDFGLDSASEPPRTLTDFQHSSQVNDR